MWHKVRFRPERQRRSPQRGSLPSTAVCHSAIFLFLWLSSLFAHWRTTLIVLFSERDTFVHVRYMPSAVRLSVVCLSVTLVHPTQPVEVFGIFFSSYDSSGTLVFWCQNSLVGVAPLPVKFAFKVTHPFQTAQFRPISAHSALTVIASEKSSISTYRKLTTRFPTSHRWIMYVTPKSPKGWHKNAISLFVPVKFNFCRKKVCYKVSLCENF